MNKIHADFKICCPFHSSSQDTGTHDFCHDFRRLHCCTTQPHGHALSVNDDDPPTINPPLIFMINFLKKSMENERNTIIKQDSFGPMTRRGACHSHPCQVLHENFKTFKLIQVVVYKYI